jgi:hypothetical protein
MRSGLRPFDEFPDESGRSAGQGLALDMFFSLPVLLHLRRIHPVDLHDLAAEKAAPGNVLLKAFQEFPGIHPHSHVGLSALFVPAEEKADGGKTSGGGAAHFPVGGQSPAEGIHHFDEVVVLFSELLLRDRKNGLASVKALHEKLHRLFLHLQGRHRISSSIFYLPCRS